MFAEKSMANSSLDVVVLKNDAEGNLLQEFE